MDTLIHADIFFFVTTIAVVVGIVFTIALIYLIKILSDIKKITGQVHEETILFREDLRNLRMDIKQKGFELKSFISFFQNLVKRKKSRSTK